MEKGSLLLEDIARIDIHECFKFGGTSGDLPKTKGKKQHSN